MDSTTDLPNQDQRPAYIVEQVSGGWLWHPLTDHYAQLLDVSGLPTPRFVASASPTQKPGAQNEGAHQSNQLEEMNVSTDE